MIPWTLAILGLAGAGLASAGLAWWAFVVWTPCNLGQLALAFRRDDRPQAILWLGFLASSLIGLVNWS